jgi:transcription-repair coupling factor (superfamily II helicase)
LRDLEIRGAGNILGSEQSGHIQLVGYQMYCELLTEAVKKLRGEPTEEALVCNVDLGFAAYIPRNYIASDRQRMELYRRIAVARGLDDLEQVRSEVGDVYGKEPAEVCALIDTAEIRIRAAKHNIGSIRVDGDDVIFVFNEKANQAVDLFACVKGTVRIGDERTVYLRLARNYFEPATLLRVLRKTLR